MVQHPAAIEYQPHGKARMKQFLFVARPNFISEDAINSFDGRYQACRCKQQIAFATPLQPPQSPVLSLAHGPIDLLQHDCVRLPKRAHVHVDHLQRDCAWCIAFHHTKYTTINAASTSTQATTACATARTVARATCSARKGCAKP